MFAEIAQDLLDTQGYVLIDGATGTNLFAMGLTSGDAPELWNVDAPEKITALYQSWADAGSNLFLTNSFGGSCHRLKLHQADKRVGELNRVAAELAREVADKAEQKMIVAGSVGPTGELIEPLGALTVAGAEEAFEEQIQALKDGGADVAWIETISAKDELAAALKAAAKVGLPAICTLSFDTNGKTMMGIAPEDMPGLVSAAGSAMGFGANCGTGPSELVAVISAMRKASNDSDWLVAKANCGIPEFKDGKIAYSGDVPLMSLYAQLALASGAQFIGGCCGTAAEHIQAMKQALDSYEPREAPGTDEIERLLGEISRPKASSANSERDRRGRRARRNA